MDLATIRNLIIRIGVTSHTREIGKVQRQLRQLQRQVRDTDRDSNRLSSTFTRLGRSIGSGLGSALSQLVRGAKLAAIGIGAVAVAAGGLHTAVQLVGGLGASLAPLAGLLAALPAAAASAAAAFGVLHLATAGMGKAFAAVASGNQEKLDKALEKLGPTARSVVMEFKRMFPTLRGIQLVAQSKFFSPLLGEVTKLTRTLAGPLRNGVGTVAHEFGMAAQQVSFFARSATAVTTVKTVLGALAGGLREVRPAIQPLLTGFAQIATVGAQFLVNLTPAIRDAAIQFGNFLSAAASSGKAMAWMQGGLLVLKQLGTLLANVGGIIMSMFRAAGTAGNNFLGTLGALAQQLNAFLRSAQGQQALTSFFQGLAAISSTLGPVISALLTQIGALAPAVGRLAAMIGPGLTAAINAVGPALAQLAPGLAAVFTGVTRAVNTLAPALVPLGQAISQIAVALAPALSLFAAFAAQLITALAPAIAQIVSQLGPPLVTLLGGLMQALQPLIPVIAQLAVQLGQQLARVIIALSPSLITIVGAFAQVLKVLLPALVPLLTVLADLVTVLAPLLPAIVGIIAALKVWSIAQMALNTVLLANPIVLIAAAIAALVVGLIVAWKHSETFRNIVTGAFRAVASVVMAIPAFFAAAFGKIASAIGAAAPAIGRVVLDILNVITYPGRVLIGLLVTPFYYAFQGLQKIVTAFWSWAGPYVTGGVKAVVNFIVVPLRGLLAAWRAIWGAVGPTVVAALNSMTRSVASFGGWLVRSFVSVANSVINVFRNAGSWLYNAGRNIIVGLWNGIASLAGWIARAIGNLIARIIPGPVRRVLGIGSPSKVMAQLGVFVGQGLAQGMLTTQKMIAGAATTLADAATPSMTSPAMAGVPAGAAPAGAAAAGAGSQPGGIDYAQMTRAFIDGLKKSGLTVQVDRQVIGQVVSGETGRRTQQQRRTG